MWMMDVMIVMGQAARPVLELLDHRPGRTFEHSPCSVVW